MKDSLVLDINIQQLMLFQQLLRKLDKLVTQEILLVGHSQALAYEKQGRATIARLVTKFRGYRRVKSRTPSTK